MPPVLTESENAVCVHTGKLVLKAGQSKLTVNKNKVLVEGDISSLTSLNGCITPVVSAPLPISKPCTLVSSVIGGVASKLTVEGKKVLLQNVAGTTDGVVINVKDQPWSVQDAGLTQLKAT